GDADFRVLTRAQNIVGVRKSCLNLNRTGLDVDLPIGSVKLAYMLVGLAIGQDHLEWQRRLRDSVLLRVNPCRKQQVVLLGDWECDFDGVELRNCRQQGRGADQIADLGLRDCRDAIYRRVDLGPSEVELSGLDRRLRRLHLRRTPPKRLGNVVESLLRYDLLLVERGIAVKVLLILL